jgi:hypothetical protein
MGWEAHRPFLYGVPEYAGEILRGWLAEIQLDGAVEPDTGPKILSGCPAHIVRLAKQGANLLPRHPWREVTQLPGT